MLLIHLPQISHGNTARHALTGRIVFHQADLLPPGDVSFDLIIANILARPLIKMAPQLVNHLAPNGSVVLSGILAEQRWKVIAAYSADLTGISGIREQQIARAAVASVKDIDLKADDWAGLKALAAGASLQPRHLGDAERDLLIRQALAHAPHGYHGKFSVRVGKACAFGGENDVAG